MSSSRDGGLINVFGFDHRPGNTFSIPTMIIEAEQYNMIMRLIDLRQAPRLRINIAATFHDDDHQNYNTVAEIPGQGDNPEIVMVGATSIPGTPAPALWIMAPVWPSPWRR